MFSGYRPCGNSDTAAKMFYVTLQDHMMEEPGDFTQENSSLYILTMLKLITINIGLTHIIILTCHVILQDNEIILSCDFIGRRHSR